MMEVNQRILYYSGGYDKRSQDGVFTHVTHVTPTGRFKVKVDNSGSTFAPDTLRQMGKSHRGFGGHPYCRLINDDNKALETKAMRRLWIDRINSFDFETAKTDTLTKIIGILNQDDK
jgi:hypothetical protein